MPTSRRLPLPAATAALALALVSSACATGSPAASPTGAPPASPEASGSPAPSHDSGSVDHPTGAGDVILRLDEGGGLMMVDRTLTQTPLFTLYGDGTVVYRDPFAQPPPGPDGLVVMPQLRTARLSEEQIQALLTFAVAEGGLGAARDRYEHPMVADAATSTFTIAAGGNSRTVAVVALDQDEGAPDKLSRSQFKVLAERLRTFEATEGLPMEDYQPRGWRAVLVESPGGPAKTFPWPWPDHAVTDFEAVADDPSVPTFPMRVLTSEEIEAMGVGDVSGGLIGYYAQGPDGKTYSIPIRPLLPDEER
jgi:hypothetical protein